VSVIEYELAEATSPRVPWIRNNFARQFILVAFAVLFLGMLAFGTWVSRRIELGVMEMSAQAAALYANSFITPHLQELPSGTLSDKSISAVDRAIESPLLRPRVAAAHVWTLDGRLVYSTTPGTPGNISRITANVERAATGEVIFDLDHHPDEDYANGIRADSSLIEIYTPVRRETDGAVIAVLQFHERGDGLRQRLTDSEKHTWLVTGLITLAMMGALFSIVRDGSKTIDQQRVFLTERVAQLSDLLQQNEVLRQRVERAARSATEGTERLMRQVGSDLHDGPAQLIALALLRLDSLKLAKTDRESYTTIRNTLLESLSDVRDLCAGLVLPSIQILSLEEALGSVIREHEKRTRTKVDRKLCDLPADVPHFVKICMLRFVQEGLTNAFRHASGIGQEVLATADRQMVSVEVVDRGPGIPQTVPAGLHLGLTLLRDRIESIGGTMVIESSPSWGTRLTAKFPLSAEQTHA